MKKTLALIAAGAMIALGGCAVNPAPGGNPTAQYSAHRTSDLQRKVLLAEYAWEGAQEMILAYKARPACTTPRTVFTCKSEAAMTELRRVNRVAVAGLDEAMKLASVPGITEDKVTAAMAVAISGPSAVQRIIAAYEGGSK
jgi:hypothetical protein